MSMVVVQSFAYDIAIENEDGVLIYYSYRDIPGELEVTTRSSTTLRNLWGYEGVRELKIPSEVTYKNRTWKVTSIAEDTFHPYSAYNGGYELILESIWIPKSINNIQIRAFEDCKTLKKVVVEDIGAWCNAAKSSNPLTIAKHIYNYNNEEITDLNIPESVKSIDDKEFMDCLSLKTVSMSNSLKSIGRRAFYGCVNIANVVIGDGVASIGSYAFYGCDKLKTVSIGSSVSAIGSYAFQNCNNLTRVIIKDVTSWCGINFEYAQYGTPFVKEDTYSCFPSNYIHLFCNDSEISDLVIPDEVSVVSPYAFHGVAGLKSVQFSDNVTRIGRDAFSGCPDLEKVIIGNGLKSISEFRGCRKLSEIQFGNNVTSIGESAFEFCGFVSLSLPNGITDISAGAFQFCTKLEEIRLPNSLKTIGYEAFYGCDQVLSVYSPIRTPFSIIYNYQNKKINPFSRETLYNATLYIPKGTKERYQNTDGWNEFLWMEEDVTSGVDKIINKIGIEISRYNIDGKIEQTPYGGINIIKTNEGIVRKILVK